jgi:hypothetical protein
VGFDVVGNKAGAAMTFVRQDNATGGHARLRGPLVNDGVWHHLAVTRVGNQMGAAPSGRRTTRGISQV